MTGRYIRLRTRRGSEPSFSLHPTRRITTGSDDLLPREAFDSSTARFFRAVGTSSQADRGFKGMEHVLLYQLVLELLDIRRGRAIRELVDNAFIVGVFSLWD